MKPNGTFGWKYFKKTTYSCSYEVGTGDSNISPLYGTIITNHHERERLEGWETTKLGDDRTVQLYCGVPVRGLVGGDIQAGAIQSSENEKD